MLKRMFSIAPFNKMNFSVNPTYLLRNDYWHGRPHICGLVIRTALVSQRPSGLYPHGAEHRRGLRHTWNFCPCPYLPVSLSFLPMVFCIFSTMHYSAEYPDTYPIFCSL